jgi:hypothetical protein
VCCKTIYVIVDAKLCVINFFRHFLFIFWCLFDLVGCMHMLDCCLRWSSARYYAAPGEVLFVRCIFQRRYGASGKGHAGSVRCMRIRRAGSAFYSVQI